MTHKSILGEIKLFFNKNEIRKASDWTDIMIESDVAIKKSFPSVCFITKVKS